MVVHLSLPLNNINKIVNLKSPSNSHNEKIKYQFEEITRIINKNIWLFIKNWCF